MIIIILFSLLIKKKKNCRLSFGNFVQNILLQKFKLNYQNVLYLYIELNLAE